MNIPPKIVNMPYLRSKNLDNSFKTKQMSREQTEILLGIMMSNRNNEEIVVSNESHLESIIKNKFQTNSKNEFFFQYVIQKRIDGFRLPLRFTFDSLLALFAFVDRVGAAVFLLIDSLEHLCNDDDTYENYKVVRVNDLVEMYPWGFYDFDDRNFQEWMNNFVKIKKYINNDGIPVFENKETRIKWAEVYE